MKHALLSLLASAALGEALLYLATNSPVKLTCRRTVLMRELTRRDVRLAMGVGGDSGIPDRLYAGEKFRTITELRRAAAYGMKTALQRYQLLEITPAGAGAIESGITRPAA